MNIDGLLYQFKNEEALRAGDVTPRPEKDYSKPDIEQFKKDMIAGAKIAEAAKKNNIPTGSCYRYVPDECKKVKDKELALKLMTKKTSGKIKLTYKAITKLCGYKETYLRALVA